MRSGRTAAAIPMQVRTETADRTLTASPDGTEPPTMRASLPARDSFLDAIAFSKGRFAVEVFGLNTALPAGLARDQPGDRRLPLILSLRALISTLAETENRPPPARGSEKLGPSQTGSAGF